MGQSFVEQGIYFSLIGICHGIGSFGVKGGWLLSLMFVLFWQEIQKVFWFCLVQVRFRPIRSRGFLRGGAAGNLLPCFLITATGRSHSDLGLPTTKLEILPGFTEYFI